MQSTSSAAPDSDRSAAPSLWRDSDFRRLWIGQTASQLGEQTSLVVLPLIAVLTLNADASQVGALRALGQAPILLFSLLAGACSPLVPRAGSVTARCSCRRRRSGTASCCACRRCAAPRR